MKNLEKSIIVVEGKTDEALIKSFLNVEIVKTNGSAISRGTLDYLLNASKNKEIIVLTDPDFPGQKIRNTISEYVPNAKHAFVNKKDAIKKHKVGIAESSKEAILEALEHLVQYSDIRSAEEKLTYFDLLELGLVGSKDSSMNREKVAEILHLGFCNGKTFLKRLNYVGLDKDELKEIING